MNNEQTEYEYLCVEVTRSEGTEIYLKVPKGWVPSENDMVLGRAAKETTTEDDWDKYGWAQAVEWQSHKPVSAEEANQFKVFDVIKYNETNPTK